MGNAVLWQRAFRACGALAALHPGAALALGEGVKLECGQHANASLHALLVMAGAGAAVAALTLLVWGGHRLRGHFTGRHAPFSFGLALAVVTGALLIASGIALSPRSSAVYAAFGAGLSAPGRTLMDYPFLLALPLLAFPFVLIRVENNPHREQYLAGFAALEFALLCLAQWTLNSPIFVNC